VPSSLRRPLGILLITAIAAGCAGLGGVEGLATTIPRESTSTPGPGTTSSTSPAYLDTTTTTIPGTVPSTTAPGTTTTTAPSPVGNACPADAVPGCVENTAAGAAYLQAHVSGGGYGFHFVRLGGAVVGSLNPGEPFYPASSIKILHAIHAMRWAGSEPDLQAALLAPIPVYQDTCAGSGPSWTEPLSTVLRAMMVDSDNQRANAIQDYFGRDSLNQTATGVLDLTGTVLAHRLGCGGPANDPPNRSTALDLSRVYAQLGSGAVLTPDEFDALSALMLGPVWPSLQAAVRAAGADLGLDPATADAFLEGTRLLYKAGWWDTYLSVGAYLSFPAPACGGPRPDYAFAVFVDGADWVATGFDVSDLAGVVLRGEVRAALEAAAGC
jgi:hypothetical protein